MRKGKRHHGHDGEAPAGPVAVRGPASGHVAAREADLSSVSPPQASPRLAGPRNGPPVADGPVNGTCRRVGVLDTHGPWSHDWGPAHCPAPIVGVQPRYV